MLTLGWAFSFLDPSEEPSGGLRASAQESAIGERPGSSQPFSARRIREM